MVTENSSPKPTLPLLKVKGFTHGWPRFEASFGGDDVNIEAMNVYLGLYGYEVVPIVRRRPKNHVTAEMTHNTPATAKPKIRPVNDVYDQYRHMDELLSDEELLKGSLKGKMLHDFWQAIKLAIGLEAQP
jgi:hypothetical protein